MGLELKGQGDVHLGKAQALELAIKAATGNVTLAAGYTSKRLDIQSGGNVFAKLLVGPSTVRAVNNVVIGTNEGNLEVRTVAGDVDVHLMTANPTTIDAGGNANVTVDSDIQARVVLRGRAVNTDGCPRLANVSGQVLPTGTTLTALLNAADTPAPTLKVSAHQSVTFAESDWFTASQRTASSAGR